MTALGKTGVSLQFPNLDEDAPITLGKAFGPSEPAPPYISSVGIHLYNAPTEDWFPVDDGTILEISISASDPIWGRINGDWDSPVGYDWEDWGRFEVNGNSADYYAEDVTWKTGCYVNASVAAHPDHFAEGSDRSDTEFVYYYGMGHAVAYPREYRNGTPHYLDWYWVPVYSSLTALRDYPY